VQHREPSPEIQKLYADKIILQKQLTYIRAVPANPTQAQRARDKLLELYANSAEIRTTTKKVQIKEMLATLLDSPDQGIAQDSKTFGPANTNTWKMIKQVNGIQEPTPPLPDNIYTKSGPTLHSAWSRGPLASNPQEAGKAWNEFRRALGSNYRHPAQSHINEYMAQLTDQNEDKRDSPALYSENMRPNPLLPHLPINEQISIPEVEAAVNKLQMGNPQEMTPSQII